MSLKIETWPIEKLIPYARNPRKNDDVVDQMAAGIREFGFRIPIVARSDGSIVDGHLRLKAAQKLGLTEVPVALADELTDTQVKAFRIWANKSANLADWDNELLKLELEDLKLDDFDLNLTGFDITEIDELLKKPVIENLESDGEPDGEPENENSKPVSQMGDIWLLGNHRLMCGDCACEASIEKLMCVERERERELS